MPTNIFISYINILLSMEISTFSFSQASIISLCEIYEKGCFHTEGCLPE